MCEAEGRIQPRHCHGCFDVLSWFKTFTFHGHFDFGQEVPQCQAWEIRWQTHCDIFTSLLFQWTALSSSGHCIFLSPFASYSPKSTYIHRSSITASESAKNDRRNVLEARAECFGDLGQCIFCCDTLNKEALSVFSNHALYG